MVFPATDDDGLPVIRKLREFQTRIRRIDQLEERLLLRIRRARRRLLMRQFSQPHLRSSHLRLYVSHSYTPELTKSGAMAAVMQGRDVKPSKAIWKLHVEGKLLIDFLDAKIQTSGKSTKSVEDEESSADRMVQPVKFTHMFDQVIIKFQTIFELVTASKPSTPKKKKSRRSSTAGKAVAPPRNEETQTTVSMKQTLAYTPKDKTPPADMWTFEYEEPPLPEPGNKWKVRSVVAYVELYRRYRYPEPNGMNTQLAAGERRYRIVSLALQKGLFPHHGPETVDMLTGKRIVHNRSAAEINAEIPLHNEVHIPCTLTMTEIANAFFTYIQDRGLVLDQDKTVVQADKLLQDIMGMEQFSFSQLQQLLLNNKLISPLGNEGQLEDPIRITYLMDIASGGVLGQQQQQEESVLQFDCDIVVPSLWGARLREKMRRIKRTELEHAAANILASKVRTPATAPDYTAPSVSTHMTLAAVAKGEAKKSAEIDARTAYLMGQLKERVPEAIRSRKASNHLKTLLTAKKRESS